ncbi:SIR2 family protein [Xanthomonas campestris]|uniref:SIR2 family protein n=1 Tax=Xanthomonas campestris TaxID=339 RepID=UPI002368512D|nr:SIR2 family protein [Xanthomonas campestris]MEB1361260.1 SIR2 family protein [Xanthomonas campestris pv. campestris]
MPLDYKQYQQEVRADVSETLRQTGCQPILFIGSGFSKRYSGSPGWEDLLRSLADNCAEIKKDFGYYKQKHASLPKIAGIFSDNYREWAWGDGRASYPDEYFKDGFSPDIFIKRSVADLLSNMQIDLSSGASLQHKEITALRKINPHAIVTTNYDQLIEPIFSEYEVVIGQKILRQPYLSIGEIFKIHGCISDPISLVLTESDYESFEVDKKYLSAKLLTYFAEHPLLFIGYSANDPNIRSVLYDVDRMAKANFALMPNIYILEWDSEAEKNYPARDRVLAVGDGREIRVKSIAASSFQWVFEAFASGEALEKVNMKLLRSLLARTIELVRRDVPTKRVEIDFQTLEHKLEAEQGVATLLGVAAIGDPAKVNIHYPFTITEVAEQLGVNHWNKVNKLIDAVTKEAGVNIKSFDNTYHISMRTGKKKGSRTDKYSQACVDLLARVASGAKYELAADCRTQCEID